MRHLTRIRREQKWLAQSRRAVKSFITMNSRLTVLLLLALFATAAAPSVGQQVPEWLLKPAPLPDPAGRVVRASTADQILSAGEQLSPGSTLLIEPGVYKFSRPMVLRGRTNTTIRSVSGEPESVTITGKGWAEGDEHDDIVHVADCDGVTLAGLTFAECRSYGVKVEAEHAPKNVQIYNCRFRNIGIRAIKGSAGQDPNVRAIKGSVRYCDFENTKVPPANWLFGGDYIAAIDMMALEDWTFSENVFRNIKGRNGGGRAAIFIWVRSRKIVVERNVIVNCDRGVAFGNPGQATANEPGARLAYVSNGTIRNNFIAGGADCGIELWHVETIKVCHNSIWRPEQNWGRGIRVGTGTVRSEVVNNLVHGGIQIEGGQAELNHNLAARLDRYFVDPASGNLALTVAATGAIDKGVVLPEVPRDIKGAPRKNAPDHGAWEYGKDKEAWVEPMRKVHARFNGTPGTFAQFGDSITYSGAFWSPFAAKPKNMSPAAAEAYQLVKTHLKPECLSQKGPSFGNQGSTTIRWAQDNVSDWLANLNPEVAVIMFGSNDVAKMEAKEYEEAVREVVAACLTNGTIVLLTTAPLQTSRMGKCLEFTGAVQKIASDMNVPLIDYCGEILKRRPNDWDGASAQFRETPEDTYEVPTLICKDGVHPSNPQRYSNDFSKEALDRNGYGLRNYLTLMAYAEVIREVLHPAAGP